MSQRFEFVVTGESRIHCSSRERHIAAALRGLPGVQHPWASALSQRVVVTVDPDQIGPEDLTNALQQIGYEAALR